MEADKRKGSKLITTLVRCTESKLTQSVCLYSPCVCSASWDVYLHSLFGVKTSNRGYYLHFETTDVRLTEVGMLRPVTW
jgi:hypothetical protein